MKKTIAILAVLALVCFTAGAAVRPAEADAASSRYVLVDMSGYFAEDLFGDMEEISPAEMLTILHNFGYTATLELGEDGNGVIDLFGDPIDLALDYGSHTINGEEDWTFTQENGRLVLRDGDSTLTFDEGEPVTYTDEGAETEYLPLREISEDGEEEDLSYLDCRLTVNESGYGTLCFSEEEPVPPTFLYLDPDSDKAIVFDEDTGPWLMTYTMEDGLLSITEEESGIVTVFQQADEAPAD